MSVLLSPLGFPMTARPVMMLVMTEQPNSQENRAVPVDREPLPTTTDLRNFLKEKLPEYMVPAVFVLLDALPLMPNGKIDRRALPSPDRSRPELDKAFVAPRTPTEELLAEIWAQLLDIERISASRPDSASPIS